MIRTNLQSYTIY